MAIELWVSVAATTWNAVREKMGTRLATRSDVCPARKPASPCRSPVPARNSKLETHRVPTRHCATSRTRWPSTCASRAGPTRTGSPGRSWRERKGGWMEGGGVAGWRVEGWLDGGRLSSRRVGLLLKRRPTTLQIKRCVTATSHIYLSRQHHHAVIFCVSLPSTGPADPPNASLLLSWPLS
jgi:hypothetical protein